MSVFARIAVVLLLVGAVFGLGVHYDVALDAHSPYPQENDLARNYSAHVGERTLVFGTVRSVDDAANRATIAVDSDIGTLILTVDGIERHVRPGGTIQVYGILERNHSIAARNIVVVNESAASTIYKYAVSIVGAALVLVLFFRRWRIDGETLTFEPRTDG